MPSAFWVGWLRASRSRVSSTLRLSNPVRKSRVARRSSKPCKSCKTRFNARSTSGRSAALMMLALPRRNCIASSCLLSVSVFSPHWSTNTKLECPSPIQARVTRFNSSPDSHSSSLSPGSSRAVRLSHIAHSFKRRERLPRRFSCRQDHAAHARMPAVRHKPQ